MANEKIPHPRSSFLRIQCECGSEQTVFSHASTNVGCAKCAKPLVKTDSARVIVLGKLIKAL